MYPEWKLNGAEMAAGRRVCNLWILPMMALLLPENQMISYWECCRKGDPFQGPKLGCCLTLRKELSEETWLTKQEILLGKGTRVENSRGREPRRTALPVARSLGFYGDGISFWVVFRQSF